MIDSARVLSCRRCRISYNLEGSPPDAYRSFSTHLCTDMACSWHDQHPFSTWHLAAAVSGWSQERTQCLCSRLMPTLPGILPGPGTLHETRLRSGSGTWPSIHRASASDWSETRQQYLHHIIRDGHLFSSCSIASPSDTRPGLAAVLCLILPDDRARRSLKPCSAEFSSSLAYLPLYPWPISL